MAHRPLITTAAVGPTVATRTDRDALQQIRADWERLMPDAAEPSVFMTPDWMSLWGQLQDHRTEPYLIELRDRGTLTGLAPLVRIPSRVGPMSVRAVRFMGGGVGADHLGFLVRADGAEGVVRALTGRLLDDADRWDVVELLRAGDSLAAPLAREVGSRSEFRLLVTDADVSPVLRLPASWQEFTRTIPSSLPSKVAYYERRLRRDQGSADFDRVADPAGLAVAWDDLVRLHGARWETRGRPGAFAEPHFATFHRQFALRALERGWLRFYRLIVAGQCVAALYCLSMSGRVSFMQGGFDPAWQRYSVGTITVAHAIRHAIEEGAREFDFLRGAEPYKMRWTTQLRTDVNIIILPRRLRSTAAVAWQRGRSEIGAGIRRVRRLVGR